MPSPTERPKLATMSQWRIDGMSLVERWTLKPLHSTSLFCRLLATLTVSQITDGVEWWNNELDVICREAYTVTSPWRMIQAQHMVHIRRRIMHAWFLLGNPRERDHFEDLDIDWMIIIEGLLEMGWEGVNLIHLAQHAECYRLSWKHDNKLANFIKCVKNFSQLRNY